MKLKLVVSTDKVGSEVEEEVVVGLEEIDGLDEAGRERLFEDYLKSHVNDHTESW